MGILGPGNLLHDSLVSVAVSNHPCGFILVVAGGSVTPRRKFLRSVVMSNYPQLLPSPGLSRYRIATFGAWSASAPHVVGCVRHHDTSTELTVRFAFSDNLSPVCTLDFGVACRPPQPHAQDPWDFLKPSLTLSIPQFFWWGISVILIPGLAFCFCLCSGSWNDRQVRAWLGFILGTIPDCTPISDA